MAAKVDPQRQIRQMVNFIMQEAHEKVNEIKISASNQDYKYDKTHKDIRVGENKNISFPSAEV